MRSTSPFKSGHGALFMLLLGVSVLSFVACRRENVPAVTSREYTEAVRAFYVGLSALQVGDDVRAEAKLKEATQLAPDEPAAWANLGLLYLRQRDFERAAESFDKARQLAPDNGHIHVLIGLLESSRGRYAEAVAALRRAIELNPQNLKALYALASEVEREGGETGEAETISLLERILSAQPDNLAVELDLARLAAKRGDSARLRAAIERLDAKAQSWPSEVREQFKALQSAASSENVRAAAPRVQFLRNVLVRVPEYRQSLAAVKLPPDVIGEPVTSPLRLTVPSSRPAPPDESLTFNLEPLATSGDVNKWTWAGTVSLAGEGPPALVLANEREVQILGGAKLPCGVTASRLSAHAIAAVDFDYDFKPDLAIACRGGLRLFKQTDVGAFTDVTARAQFPAATVGDSFSQVWAFDLEADGDLDLVLGGERAPAVVLQNNGDGAFKELQPLAGASGLLDFVWGDFDGDGDTDVTLMLSAGGARTASFYANERGGQFHRRELPPGLGATIGLGVGDANNDGWLDLLVLGADGVVRRISDKSEGSDWEVAELARWPDAPGGLAGTNARLFVADFDNNGGLDLLASGGSALALTQVWLSDGQNNFKPRTGINARAFSVADVNGDGRLDVVGLSDADVPVRVLGRGAKNYHWQVIRPRAQEATGDQRINSFGVGGEIEIRAGLLTQKQPIVGPVVHFGLGEQAQTDVARITWPNGVLQAEFELKADTSVLAEQRLKGSCPWVFAYDGRQISFVTDTLWRSPLGLKLNAQDTAGVMMTEEWIKIGGDQLAPRAGFYDVRITAELWETHFFDHVSLMVVDHPAGTEVFVDERFAVPPPALAVHAAAPPRSFAAARDDGGANVLEVVSAQDGRYLDNFGRGQYQGVTREHFVELELPADAPREGPLWLVGSGWIHPTDSSINVAVSQGGQPKPQGLSLEVADGRGGWTTALPALGFPAGKNKTVLIDLSNVFPAGAPRNLRLRTNLEIFWDRLAWSTGLPATELRTQRLSPGAAELRFRGYSVVTQADESSPELPDYNRLAGTAPIWRDLIGYHTRFGDVRELLKSVDDRYVIMNAGDEMIFRFGEVAGPPAGWVRD
ncbi:MAG: FG-GAP-like repeat-containing protein, partial [Pyrinomonadaceae bacterium]